MFAIRRSQTTDSGVRPPRYGRTEDIALRTVGRGPVPRRAPVFTANVRGFWAADVSRLDESSRGTGPRATVKPFSVGQDRPILTCLRLALFAIRRSQATESRDRPPRYGSAEDIALRTVGRGPVPRRAPVFTANVRGFWAADVSRFGRQIAGGQAPALR